MRGLVGQRTPAERYEVNNSLDSDALEHPLANAVLVCTVLLRHVQITVRFLYKFPPCWEPTSISCRADEFFSFLGVTLADISAMARWHPEKRPCASSAFVLKCVVRLLCRLMKVLAGTD